jgi:outer membrane protein assembly factor BamB
MLPFFLGGFVSLDATAGGADWPGFRGARTDGKSLETGFFNSEGVRLELVWKRPIGGGYAGVSIAGGRAITAFSDGQSDVVAAFDTGDGRELWRTPIGETYRGHDGSQDGPIPTPVVHDGRVFVLAPRGQLIALNLADGDEVWSRDLVALHGAVKPHWGFGTSPLVAAGVDRYFRSRGYRPAGGEAHDGSGADSMQNRTDDLLETLFPRDD